MPYHTENCSYVWDDGLPDPASYERREYHWHVTEGDKQLVQAWCDLNNYSDMFIQPDAPDKFWAYPPNAAMPEPIKMEMVQQWFNGGQQLQVWI